MTQAIHGKPAKNAPRRPTRRPPSLIDYTTAFLASDGEIVDWIKARVDAREFQRLVSRLSTSEDRVYSLLGFGRSTIKRRLGNDDKLSQEESERAIGLSQLVGLAETIVRESGSTEPFDAAAWVGAWLEQPNPALGNATPASYMDTVKGQQLVRHILAMAQGSAYA